MKFIEGIGGLRQAARGMRFAACGVRFAASGLRFAACGSRNNRIPHTAFYHLLILSDSIKTNIFTNVICLSIDGLGREKYDQNTKGISKLLLGCGF